MRRVARSFAVPALAGLAALAGCDRRTAARHAAALPGESVYQLGGAWVDAAGHELELASLRGQPVVLAMFFSHCPSVCPRLVGELQAIETALGPAARARFVLASFDHVRDQPRVLAGFARERGLDPARWTLLHGDAGSVRELAAVLGVTYEPTPSGDFVHGNVIAILDAEGRLAQRYTGLGTDAVAAAARVAALTTDR